jgi:hypothetical protein
MENDRIAVAFECLKGTIDGVFVAKITTMDRNFISKMADVI